MADRMNLRLARNTYNVFGTRNVVENCEQQREQKTELLKGNRRDSVRHLKNGVEYINPNEEDEMEIYGYKRNFMRFTITWFSIVASFGFLRLVFHWYPQWLLKATHSKCRLEEAETVLLREQFQGKHLSYHVRKIEHLTADQVVKSYYGKDNTIPSESWSENNGIFVAKEEKQVHMLSVHLSGGYFKQVESVVMFKCKKIKYIWDAERGEFLRLRGLDQGVPTSTLHQSTGLSTYQQFMRRSVYDSNEIAVPINNLLTLICLEVLNPYYIFQIGTIILWVADSYVAYAIAIFLMASYSIGLAAFQTRRNQRNLRSTVSSSDVATVLRDRGSGLTANIPAEQLVPGDVLVIPSHGCQMPCDAVLLTGNCILNESMLTGESVPVTKTPIPTSPGDIYDTKEHARHTLYSGTRVLQTRYFGTEKVLAVVIRTGFNTSKGGLVRSIMYPPPVDFKFEKDSYKFVGILGVIAAFGSIYTAVTKTLNGDETKETILKTLDLITIVVPPALPAAMTVGRIMAQNRLVKKLIYCTSPRAINISGSIDCICFDKTGTLTEDGLDMWGVVPALNTKFQYPVKDIKSLALNDMLMGMVTCHTITIIDNQLVGDPLDLKMFESTGWILEEPDVSDTSKFSMLFPTVVRPPPTFAFSSKSQVQEPSSISSTRQNSMLSDALDNVTSTLNNVDEEIAASTMSLAEQGLEIGIVRQFPFTSSLQRMSVISRTLGANHYDLHCKGSPEIIHSLSKPETIPADFDSILEEYTSEGYRVIALAYKSLKRLPYAKVQRLAREAAECELEFLGFVVLENRLKPETSPVIEALNVASIKIVMVTGDNMLTALSVARDCDMIQPGIQVIAVTTVYPPLLAHHHQQAKPHVHFTRSNGSQSSPSQTDECHIDIIDVNSVVSLDTVETGSFSNNNRNEDANATYASEEAEHASNKYVFALTGKTWAAIKQHYPEMIPKLVTRGAVFARMSPDQKQQLVQELQAMGYNVAMVGDGANDCGALKAAHTGISLSDTESSVASPFTSRETNIFCVLTVMREGRAALVSSFGIFKYMATYSLTQFISVMLLYDISSNLTDYQFLYIDLFIITILAYFFSHAKAYEGPLVKSSPLAGLLGLTTILSIVLQILFIGIVQYTSLWHARHTTWYEPPEDLDVKGSGCYDNYTIFIVSCFQYIILAIVFSKGRPYRKSVLHNTGLLTSAVIFTLLSSYLATAPFPWLADRLEMVLPGDVAGFQFRLMLIGYGFLNFLVAMFLEYFIVEYLVQGKLKPRLHNVDKSKRSYLRLERDMDVDLSWPPLSAEPEAVVSGPAGPEVQQNFTEIKIEKRIDEEFLSAEGLMMSSPDRGSSRYQSFCSAREVTLNPRSLVNGNTISLQTVPNFYEERDVTPMRNLGMKRRYNSECENDARLRRNQEVNAIATLPRHSINDAQQQQHKLRDLKCVLLHKSEDLVLRCSVQNGLELDNLPS